MKRSSAGGVESLKGGDRAGAELPTGPPQRRPRRLSFQSSLSGRPSGRLVRRRRALQMEEILHVHHAIDLANQALDVIDLVLGVDLST